MIARIALGVVLCSCTTDSTDPPGSRAFSARLDDDPMLQARAALERDAWRRERRFRNAIDPRSDFDATRLEDDELAAWSNERAFEIGAQLFHLTWTRELGFGGRDRPAIARFHLGRRGGPDASRCASCHWRGGPAGAGDAADNAYLDGDGDRQASALARNPRPLHGLGLLDALAREMTAGLAAIRRSAIETSQRTGERTRVELVARGISFGFLSAGADGVDVSEVRGVDADLVIRPFGWKGHAASLREVVDDELLVHHGIESDALVAAAEPARVGPFGGSDPDGDGVEREATDGQVTALVVFVAMQEVPVVELPVAARDASLLPEGEALFASTGCAECHRPSVHLERPIARIESPAGAREIDLSADGADPRIATCDEAGCELALFSDLRRHDMGPELADPRDDRGVPAAQFLTPPLWGIARSRPYLHDGRAPTIDDAIRAHGGEAAASRDVYVALEPHERGALRVYLTSLTRARRLIAP